jgi:arylsulfatase A-like enzyme
MSDEHNASVLGANGNRIVQTPALDRLAAAA